MWLSSKDKSSNWQNEVLNVSLMGVFLPHLLPFFVTLIFNLMSNTETPLVEQLKCYQVKSLLTTAVNPSPFPLIMELLTQ